MGALGALFIKPPVLLSGSDLAVSGCVQEAAGFHRQSSGGVGEALTGDTGWVVRPPLAWRAHLVLGVTGAERQRTDTRQHREPPLHPPGWARGSSPL